MIGGLGVLGALLIFHAAELLMRLADAKVKDELHDTAAALKTALASLTEQTIETTDPVS